MARQAGSRTRKKSFCRGPTQAASAGRKSARGENRVRLLCEDNEKVRTREAVGPAVSSISVNYPGRTSSPLGRRVPRDLSAQPLWSGWDEPAPATWRLWGCNRGPACESRDRRARPTSPGGCSRRKTGRPTVVPTCAAGRAAWAGRSYGLDRPDAGRLGSRATRAARRHPSHGRRPAGLPTDNSELETFLEGLVCKAQQRR